MNSVPRAPGSPFAASMLLRSATQLLQQGKLDEAARQYQSVLVAFPTNFDALHMLGVARAQQGRLSDSAMLLRRAVRAQPRSAAALNNLGITLNLLGRHREAVEILGRAVSFEPSDPVAHNNLGNANRALGHLGAALRCFRQAVALQPNYAEALSNLGAVLHALDRDEEALAPLAKSVAVHPGLAAARMNLGLVLAALERSEEALEALQQAVALDPRSAAAWADLGTVQLELGQIQEARSSMQQALRLDPGNADLHFRLAQATKASRGDPRITRMEALLAHTPAADLATSIFLHFALAKSWEDAGDEARGFDHLRRGNALQRTRLVYDEAATLAGFDRSRAVFSTVRAQPFDTGSDSCRPIFIVGMMRSGSTLVEQVLASHPQIFAGGERPHFAMTLAALGVDYPDAVPALGAGQLTQIGNASLARLGAPAGSAPRVTD